MITNSNWQPRVHEWRVGPFGVLAEQRFDDMMWFRFDWYSDERESVFEFPWLLIPAWLALMMWLRNRRKRAKLQSSDSGTNSPGPAT